MKNFVKAMDNLPLIVKLILALPVLDIIWAIVRVCRSIAAGNVLGIVLSIVMIVVGIPFMWLIDIICILVSGRIWWID